MNFSLVFRGGTYLDPRRKGGARRAGGLSSLAERDEDADAGAARGAARLPRRAAPRSGSVRRDDRGTVTLNLLSKDLDEGLAILREVLTEPRFAEERDHAPQGASSSPR